MSDASNAVIDYAIIGGGISGIYSAWRLKKAYPKKNIVLFEYSHRIGGRLMTTLIKDTEVNAELGGMRYMPQSHKLVNSLIEYFNLESRVFPMGSKADPTGQHNYAYFRGKNLKIGDFQYSDKVPFNVTWAERDKTPDDLQTYVMELLVPNWKELSFDDWFNVKVFDKPLWEFGFWNLLYRVLSPDAYAFMRYGSGYDTNVSNGNAVTLLPTGGEYSPDNQYRTLVDGMEALPRALEKEYRKDGGVIHFNRALDGIYRLEDGTYRLTFHLPEAEGKHAERTPMEHRAEHVILAMPRGALERIDWEMWKSDPWLSSNFGSVLIQGALKIFMAYRKSWWTQIGLISGRSITDLPIRQTYYFTAFDVDGNPKTNHGVLMASYNDLDTIPFWKGLESGDLVDGPKGSQATEKMVREAHRQVLELHGIRELDLPYAAAYHDWSDAPYYGGWHSWKAGYEYNKIMPRMRHPVPSEKVYICGEAYSADQGWAEGALETAEQLLSEDLHVKNETVTSNHRVNFLKRLQYAPNTLWGG